jgi:hypothetical protein
MAGDRRTALSARVANICQRSDATLVAILLGGREALMTFILQDVFGLALAIVLALPLLALPGAMLAAAGDLLGFKRAAPAERTTIALLCALAILPILVSLTARFASVGAALALVLLVCAAALPVGWRLPLSLPAGMTLRGLGLAATLLAVVSVDIVWDGRLYPSLLAIDTVKHAAFTRAIADTGVTPPPDPFFLRQTAASYYYFYYVLAALVERLGFGLCDQRAAYAGLLFWTGVATVAFANFLYDRAGFARRTDRHRLPLLLLLMFVGGMQLVFVAAFRLKGETWREQSGWLADMVSSWTTTTLWVPHHLAAFLAAWFALLVIAARPHERTARTQAAATVTAGFAFASCIGLSVWVAIGAAAVAAVWLALLAIERRWALVMPLAASGLVATVAIAPQLLDLAANRDFSAFPIALRVRMYPIGEALATATGTGELARLLLLPAHYFIEAALLVVGSVLFWQRRQLADVHRNEVARLLTISAVTTLGLGSVLASSIANNDFGWRVILFAQMAALLWTCHILLPFWQRAIGRRASLARFAVVPRPLAALLVFGFCAGLHDAVMLRAHVVVNQGHPDAEPRDGAVDHDLRAAYAWLALSTPRSAVVQHNPNRIRTYAFGLYGRNPVAVSDLHSAPLFGAAPSDVARRIAALTPVFRSNLPAADVRARLNAAGITYVLITSMDPAWQQRAAWLSETPPVFATRHLRIIRTTDLAADRLAGRP